jgi:hypothetical protein
VWDSLKGRAWPFPGKKKKKKQTNNKRSAPCFREKAEWPFLFLEEAVTLILIFLLSNFIENS